MSKSAALGLAALVCGAALAGERTYYECTLNAALPGDRDVVLMVALEGEQVREHVLMVPAQAATAQRMKEPRLRVEDGRLRGPVEMKVPPVTGRFDLDVPLGQNGTFQIHYGCPVAPRKVAGDVTVELPKDPKDKRHVIWLHQALGPETRLGLVLNLDRTAKTVGAQHGWGSGYNTAHHRLDVSRLTFDGNRLEGEVDVTVLADGYVPEHGQPVEGAINLTVSLDATEKAGNYSATFGIDKTRPGNAVTKQITAAEMRTTLALLSQVVSDVTPWRVWLATGPGIRKAPNGSAGCGRQGPKGWEIVPLTAENARLSELPPADWRKPGYDDSLWGRHGQDLSEYLGGWGVTVTDSCDPALLCLRTRFGVSDPAQAQDVQVFVEYLGGLVVYVNGVEVGRENMPAGALEPHTPAADYPVEAYTADDGTTPLPLLNSNAKPEAKWLPRYRARARRTTVSVPVGALVKGANVLALELHRAPVCGPIANGSWSHLGFREARVTSLRGAGVIAYADALKGTRVWSAQSVDEVAESVPTRSLLHYGWSAVNTRGMAVKGILGNPFDPVLPIRILVPRNGIGNGQAVLSDPDGLHGVQAGVADFRGPGGAVLPASAVHLRFATQAGLHWCDDLREKPPDGARTLPVWLEVKAARDQTPGWYVSTLSLEANGKKFQVPVQVFVTGFAVPDARDFRSLVVGMHSPEALAKSYEVKPYSDAHFKLMAKSLEMLGQLGNDVMFVPVITGTHMSFETGLIRWIKTARGLEPDFRLLEKYIDLYLKYCAPPKAISLYIWSADTSKEIADVYEGRQIPSREFKPTRPFQVTQCDPDTGETGLISAPIFTDEGAVNFWKPMLDGVQALVKKRGWSDRLILLGCGSDLRPSRKTGELFREWAPYARWDIYSHFSGDPGGFAKVRPEDVEVGRYIATGELEVGLKEIPHGGVYSSAQLEKLWGQKVSFLDMSVHRCVWDEQSSPMAFRTVPLHNGRLARVGLDFWPRVSRYYTLIWGTQPARLASRGADGPEPTVRFQLVREGLQDFEARLTVVEALAKLPADQQKTCRAVLDDYFRRYRAGESFLSQTELGYDWLSYVARVYRAAEEVSGITTDARWEQPPAPGR